MGTVVRRSMMMVIVLLFLSLPMVISAQQTGQSAGSCDTLVTNAFTEVGATCANLDQSMACLGNNTVGFEFFGETPEDFTDEAGARTPLLDVSQVSTQGADLQENTWGVTVFNALSSVPRSLDQHVVMVGFGGVQIANVILPEDAFIPVIDGILVTTTSAAESRVATMALPAESEVLGVIPAGESVIADAVSEDGLWVRVVYDDRPVWIPVSSLDPATSLDSLPAFGPESFTTMQSVCLGDDPGRGQCGANAPSLLFLQSPSDFPAEMRLQETDLRFQGTTVFQIQGNRIEMSVVNGVAILNPDTPDEIIVPAGFKVDAPLGNRIDTSICGPGGGRPITGDWSAPRQMSQGDLNQFALLEDFPDNLLNDPIILPEIPEPSGVGNPRSEILLRDPVSNTIIPPACQPNGAIPADLCEAYAF